MAINFSNTAIAFSSKSDKELQQAHFLFKSMSSPFLTKWGIRFTKFAFQYHLPIKGIIKKTIFNQFCGGETIEEANETALKLSRYKVNVIMDYAVEGKSDESLFDKTTQTFINTIQVSADKDYVPFISLKVTGFCRFQLLEKIHLKENLSKEEEQEFERFVARVDLICNHAHQCQKMILIDAEESWIQNPIDDVTNRMMMKYNKESVCVFNTFQMYRHDRLQSLKDSHQLALNNHFILGAKLVRGAYMERERQRASDMGYTDPIQPNKESCDRDYNAGVTYCIENINSVVLFNGTHNEDSSKLGVQLMEKYGLLPNDRRVWFSQLYGMSENISFNLADAGYCVAKYLPYGPVQDVVPYLMRRAQENTSVAGQTGRELSLIQKELERRKHL